MTEEAGTETVAAGRANWPKIIDLGAAVVGLATAVVSLLLAAHYHEGKQTAQTQAADSQQQVTVLEVQVKALQGQLSDARASLAATASPTSEASSEPSSSPGTSSPGDVDLLDAHDDHVSYTNLNLRRADPANPLGIGNKTYASTAWGWGPPNSSYVTRVDFHLDGKFKTIQGRVGVLDTSLPGCRATVILATETGKALKGSGTYSLGQGVDFNDDVTGAATLQFSVTMTTNMNVGNVEKCSGALGGITATPAT